MKDLQDLNIRKLKELLHEYDCILYFCKTTKINYLSHSPLNKVSGWMHHEWNGLLKCYCELTNISRSSIRGNTVHRDSGIIYYSDLWSIESEQYPLPIAKIVDNYTQFWVKSF